MIPVIHLINPNTVPMLIHNCCLCSNWSNIIDNISLLTSLFAFVLTLGYWIKPRLRFCIYEKPGLENEKQWKVKVINRNFLRNDVIDIHCEISLSKNESFSIAKKLHLVKDSTLLLSNYPDEYIFKTETNKKDPANIPDNKYEYIRVRLVAPNFLGVRKVFQEIKKVSQLQKEDYEPNCED